MTDIEHIIGYSENLQSFAVKCGDYIGDVRHRLVRQYGIDAPEKLRKAFENIMAENRLLNIGIVGRVKAGKSSLLNALLFAGQDVLPKAATPMTAALTTLTWGEHLSVTVNFFDAQDRAGIAAKAEQYERECERWEKHYFDAFQSKQEEDRQRNRPIKTFDIREKARKQAELEMKKRSDLVAAHEQLQMMQKANINLEQIQTLAHLEVNDEYSLAIALNDYVGTEGCYMPFTKSVDIAMPLKTLEGVRIIDTPGLNDPVQSREARTVELLKECDVIFIVSPAGQFLNEQDQDVMSRITRREGVRELALVASQVDTELFGSEKRQTLEETLETLRANLSKRAQTILSEMVRQVGPVFEELNRSVQKSLLHSSGMCGSLHDRFDQRSSWAEPEQHVWKNLTLHFPDYFSDAAPEVSRASLKKLSNMEALHGVIEHVAGRKEKILGEKLTNLGDTKQKSLEDYQAEILKLIKHHREIIGNADIKELAAQRELLSHRRECLKRNLDAKYRDFINDSLDKMTAASKSRIQDILKSTESSFSDAVSETTSTRKVEREGAGSWIARNLWGGGYESVTDHITKIRTPQIVSKIEKFADKAPDVIRETATETRKQIDKDLSDMIVQAVREVFEDQLNQNPVLSAMNRVLEPLRRHIDDFDPELPDQLRGRGTLQSPDAEDFIQDLDQYIATLTNQINHYVKNLFKKMRSEMPKTLSDEFANILDEKIAALEKQTESKQQTLDHIDRLIKEGERIKA